MLRPLGHDRQLRFLGSNSAAAGRAAAPRLPPRYRIRLLRPPFPLSSSPSRQLALQAAATIVVLSLAWPYFGLRAEAMPWLGTSLCIGGVAGLLALLSRQAWWWCAIHTGFMPLAWAVYGLALDPLVFLAAFMLLLLVYRGAVTEQVPLYLSGRETVAVLADLLSTLPAGRFVDLGAGVGSTLLPLARAFPTWRFLGCENAPVTWLIGDLRCRGRTNIDWRWGDLWQTPLGETDLAYAFLSPAPMADLWDKVRREMRPGSLFVSNSFPVPEVEAAQVIEVPDTARRLYCYPIPDSPR